LSQDADRRIRQVADPSVVIGAGVVKVDEDDSFRRGALGVG
jgi:hypothetical protein